MKGQHSPVQQRAPQSGPGRQSMRRGVRACGTGPQVCAAAMEEVSGSERPGLEGRPLPDTWGELGRGRQAGHLPLTVHTRPAYSQPACHLRPGSPWPRGTLGGMERTHLPLPGRLLPQVLKEACLHLNQPSLAKASCRARAAGSFSGRAANSRAAMSLLSWEGSYPEQSPGAP